MKPLILAASISIALAGVAGEAAAGCTAGPNGAAPRPVTGPALRTLLSGNTICVAASGGGWEWQELHKADGTLRDWKRGPTDAVDRSEDVGRWNVNRAGNVVHTYNGGSSFTWAVFDNGNSTYSFCAGGRDIVATKKTGEGACP